jgi:hypothetical protein
MLVAAVACLSHYGTSDTLLEAAARSRAGELRRLDGLVSEVEAVKQTLLGLEDRRAAARREQQLAVRAVHLSQPAHTDSFDYSASVGHEPLGQGEWMQRDSRDDRLDDDPWALGAPHHQQKGHLGRLRHPLGPSAGLSPLPWCVPRMLAPSVSRDPFPTQTASSISIYSTKIMKFST